MNYTNLFNTLHSEVISEEAKEDVLSKILDKIVVSNEDLLEESIHEGEDRIAPLSEVLSILVNSDITDEALKEAIDDIFANESQEVIDSVTESFKEDVVRGILVEQLLVEEGLDEGIFEDNSAPIGLAAIRKAAGEPVLQPKAQAKQAEQAKKPEAAPPKQESTPKTKSPLYVMKNPDGTYKGGKTSAMKDTVLKARAEAQKKAEYNKQKSAYEQRAAAGEFKTKEQKQQEKIEANKAKTASKLAKTGSSEPVVDYTNVFKKHGEKEYKKRQIRAKLKDIIKKAKEEDALAKSVKGATEKRKQRVTGEKKTISNIEKGISGVKYSDKVQGKLDKVKGNKGATEAVLHSKEAEAEKEKQENGQLKLDLSAKGENTQNSTNDNEKKASPKPPKVRTPRKPRASKKPATPKPEAKPEKPETKAGANVGKPDNKDVNKTETQKDDKKPSVYIKGGSTGEGSKKEKNFDASKLDQELKSISDDMQYLKELKGTMKPEEYDKKRSELKKKYDELKKQKTANVSDSLSGSLLPLFRANLSEDLILDIIERACNNNKK